MTETEREVAVVGGRRKFKVARGFAISLSAYFTIESNRDSIVE